MTPSQIRIWMLKHHFFTADEIATMRDYELYAMRDYLLGHRCSAETRALG